MADQERERQLLRDRVLGWSPACEPIAPGVDLGRDIRLEVSPAGRDFARVTGIDALGQSLAIALTTLLGSDLFNTQFGFDGLNALVEETNPILARERIRVAVIQVLRRDPRVRRIVDVKLEDGRLDDLPGGSSGLQGLRDSRQLDVRVVFETVTGEQVSVNLSGLATQSPTAGIAGGSLGGASGNA